MKQLFSFSSLFSFNYAGRLLVTLVAMLVLFIALRMVITAEKFLMDTQKGLKNMPGVYVSQPSASAGGSSSGHVFWPEFPHNDQGIFQSTVIDGVETLTEEWQCNAAPDDVLAYYREQMTARGWHDDTEKTYNLDPDLRGTTQKGVEDQQFLASYRDTMNTQMMLKRDKWSLHISIEPASRGVTVKFFAASTPSIENFLVGMSAGAAANKTTDGQPIDVVQQNGNDHYHTTIVNKNETPDQVFRPKLAELAALGWSPVMALPKDKTPHGYFVWLVKGRQYAALSINTPAQGGSITTFTEVTPASDRR